jgi:hypothetical protein
MVKPKVMGTKSDTSRSPFEEDETRGISKGTGKGVG